MITAVVRRFGFLLVLWVFSGITRAEIVQDMYSADIPVTDQSSAELSRAARAGLSQVLVKVSGSMEVLGNPQIAQAMKDARNRLQRYSYSDDPSAATGLLVNMLFDSAFITQLVIEAGVPLWTANRPVVLVWLVQEDAGGRQFVNVDTQPVLATTLRTEFSRRAVPVQVPLYDLLDTAAISADQAWGLGGAIFEQASARYNLQDILAGRLAQSSTGQVVGEWVYLREGERLTRSVTVENEALFLREGVALVAESMAARYAVAAVANDGGLTLAVSGVSGYSDYAAIVSWLEGLELVQSANVEKVGGDTLLLRLQAQADVTQLATLIELNKRLTPVPVTFPGPESAADLSYQWQ